MLYKRKHKSVNFKNKEYNLNDKPSPYKYIRSKLRYKSNCHNNSMSNLNISTNYYNNSQIRNYYNITRNKKNNFLSQKNKKINQYQTIPIFKVNKRNSISIICENEKYKIICNRIEENTSRNKLFLNLPKFNYSCSIDKNNIFCLKYKEPKENIRKKTINMIYQLNNIKTKNQCKKPRMIKIIEKNDKIHDEIFSYPWKYPYLFKD